jgi:ATP synthase protein I
LASPKPLSLYEFATLGIEFGAVLILFSLGGAWLDRRLGSSPVLVIVGTFAGAGGGIFSMYRRLMRRQRNASTTKTDGQR